MVRILTDTAADITAAEAAAMQVTLIPLEITFEDGPCPQREAADFARFYQRLATCDRLPQTSRPAPQTYLDVYQEAARCGDDVVALCISSGLSGTYESAVTAQQMCGGAHVHVVDTHQAILTQRMLVEEAVRMRDAGASAADVARRITDLRDKVAVCGVVGTLRYLRKGGRIPASLALLGEMMNIKPVIVLRDRKLTAMGKVRGYASGVAMLHRHMEEDGFDPDRPVYFGYTSDPALGRQLQEQTCAKYSLRNTRLHPVGGVIGTHCGTGCMAVAYFRK